MRGMNVEQNWLVPGRHSNRCKMFCPENASGSLGSGQIKLSRGLHLNAIPNNLDVKAL